MIPLRTRLFFWALRLYQWLADRTQRRYSYQLTLETFRNVWSLSLTTTWALPYRRPHGTLGLPAGVDDVTYGVGPFYLVKKSKGVV